MGHVVFVTYGITSYLNASYELARQLRERGHSVTFVSSFDCGAAVRAQGYAFELLSAENALRDDPEKLSLERASAVRRYLRWGAQRRVGQRQRDFALTSRELEETLARLAPDVLLIDEELPEVIIRCTALGYPLLLLQFFASTRQASNVPPLHTGLQPGRTLAGKLRVVAAWQTMLLKRRLTYALAPLYFGGSDRRSTLRALARYTGFDFDDGVSMRHWLPLTFPALTTLHLTAREFDYPSAALDQDTYVGPMVALDRQENTQDAAYQAALAAIAARQAAATEPRPLIYASIGTFWVANAAVIRRLVALFANRPNWDLILSIGRTISAEKFAPLPPNVHLLPHVPQLDLLRRADLMLTHGGIASINEAILLGVPLVVASGGKIDQDGNAARVAYHGLGERVDLLKDDPAAVAATIATVLADSGYRQRVAAMQVHFNAYRTSGRAVQLIERRMGYN